MRSLDRRAFIKATVAAGAAGSLSSAAAARGASAPGARRGRKAASDVVTLGRTGVKLSRLAIGTGTNGTNKTSVQARLGKGGLADLLAHGFSAGITFWDTADQYGTHEHIGEGLKRVGKNKVVVLTKTHARTAAEMTADLDRFRREIGRDYLDIVLLHNMQSATWPEERAGAMEVLERAREKGVVRAHGVSCHTLAALKVAAKTPWVQVDLARINPIQAHMDSDPDTVVGVLREMKRAGKAVIGMKILGAGRMKAELDRALAYATALDCVDAFTIGFASKAQLDEVSSKISGA
jgi:1-deoxyxylulose-5-phosphate synthase